MKKISAMFGVISFFIASLPAEFALAIEVENGKEKDQKFFNPEIYSISKKKESSFDAASATYVLASEEIRRSGATSIPEALRLVPGLQVARINGNQWAISARGFNSQYSNKLLVMIDGRTIYTPLFSGVFWDTQDYVMEDIDRVEVVRGPGGSIWGANAVNGVINIITKNAAQTQGAYVSQIVGTQDKSITEARYGGTTASNDSYRLYVKKAVRGPVDRYATGGVSQGINGGDGNTRNSGGFKYDITSIQDNKISIHGDVSNGRAGNYFNLTAPGTGSQIADKTSREANFVVNWDKRVSKVSNFNLQTYFDYSYLDTDFLKVGIKTYDIDFQHFYDFSQDNQFSWGAGYRQIDDNISEGRVNAGVFGSSVTPFNYEPNSLRSYIYSGFLQDKISMFDDKVSLTLGSKFLVNNYTGFEIQPSIKLAYYPSRNQTLWSSISRAVRTPTRGEDGLNLIDGYQVGRRGYHSENVVAYEMGYRIKPTSKTSLDIATYFNKYSSLRTFDVYRSTLRSGLVTTSDTNATNNGYGEAYGVEVSGKWQATDDWKLEASYDFYHADFHLAPGSTDASLQAFEGLTPESQFKLKSFYNITPKLEFDNIVYYVSGLPKAGEPRTLRGMQSYPTGIPSYVRFDTRLGYLLTKNLDLSLGVQDLFDQTHSEFKAATLNVRSELGRTVYVKAVWQY